MCDEHHDKDTYEVRYDGPWPGAANTRNMILTFLIAAVQGDRLELTHEQLGAALLHNAGLTVTHTDDGAVLARLPQT